MTGSIQKTAQYSHPNLDKLEPIMDMDGKFLLAVQGLHWLSPDRLDDVDLPSPLESKSIREISKTSTHRPALVGGME